MENSFPVMSKTKQRKIERILTKLKYYPATITVELAKKEILKICNYSQD